MYGHVYVHTYSFVLCRKIETFYFSKCIGILLVADAHGTADADVDVNRHPHCGYHADADCGCGSSFKQISSKGENV